MTKEVVNENESFTQREIRKGAKALQFATFYLDKELFGINILQVQEILMHQRVTPVPLADAFVLGLISIRGQIVTAVDLRRRIGIATQRAATKAYHIVVKSQDAVASLEVDRIGEVMAISAKDLEPPPDTLKGIDPRFLEGMYPLKHEILAVLNIDQILAAN
ncbi:MAG: chemotaxis protein CheW [Deltaproteobacteria bacterium]|nr:chemotaxis protein CheW [Deltaproteobacteria bacterium]